MYLNHRWYLELEMCLVYFRFLRLQTLNHHLRLLRLLLHKENFLNHRHPLQMKQYPGMQKVMATTLLQLKMKIPHFLGPRYLVLGHHYRHPLL